MVAAREKWVGVLQAKLRAGIYARRNGKKTAWAHRISPEIVALFDLEPDGTMPNWPEYRAEGDESVGTLLERVSRAEVGEELHIAVWEDAEEEGEDEDARRSTPMLATLRPAGRWDVGQGTVTSAELQRQIADGTISSQPCDERGGDAATEPGEAAR